MLAATTSIENVCQQGSVAPQRLQCRKVQAHLSSQRVNYTVRAVDADPLHSKHPDIPSCSDYGLGPA